MGCACACTSPRTQVLSCLEPLNVLCCLEVDKKTVSYPATTLHRIDTHYWVQYAWRDTQNESRLETALWNSAVHQVCRVKLEVKKYIFHVLRARVLLFKKKKITAESSSLFFWQPSFYTARHWENSVALVGRLHHLSIDARMQQTTSLYLTIYFQLHRIISLGFYIVLHRINVRVLF